MYRNNSAISTRLIGLDLARFIAFAGMVIVNFKIVMGADEATEWLGVLTGALEGRVAATFVVLAGVGLGLSRHRSTSTQTISVTLRRGIFLLILGLLNMLVFDADILHYYAFYFFFGVLLLDVSNKALLGAILLINVVFVSLLIFMDYDTGWNWDTAAYYGFWSMDGFIRNLFFNGWHPVFPWLTFFLFGIWLARHPLQESCIQTRLILVGCVVVVVTEIVSFLLTPVANAIDPLLAQLVTTKPIPPMILYVLSGVGVASVAIGFCLKYSEFPFVSGFSDFVTPAGRQTLTLYIAHILVGMGTLEALGMLGDQSIETVVLASLLFCFLAIIYARIWSSFFRRGPFELLMRKLAG